MTGRRLAALFLKDALEHGLVLGLVGMLLFLGWALFALAALGAPTTMTYLDAHAAFMRLAVPMAGLALGNRLVVAEVSGRTQRFLESLPLRTWEPLAVKWSFGLAYLGAVTLGSLVLSLALAAFREPIDAWFVAILLVRSLVAVACGWSFFFAMGLLGKLRVPVYLLLFLGLVLIASTTSLELMRFGPFALLGPDLSLERARMPWEPILQSLGLTLAFLGAAGVLAFVREGSVEERLAKPMSQRDLAMAGIAFFAVLVVWGELQPEPEPAPYEMAEHHVLFARTIPLAIGYVDDDARPDAERLLSRLEADVGSLAEAAGWTRLPQLRVVLRRSLDGSTFEPVTLARDDGVLVRANFLATADPDLDGLSAELLGRMLDARTRGRSLLEPRRWTRDGLALHWALRSAEATSRPRRVAQALRLTAMRGPDAPRMAHFERLREEHGPSAAAALAATGFSAFEDDVAARVARVAFPPNGTDDLRVVLRDWLHPVDGAWAEATGLREPARTRRWNEHLDALRRESEPARILASLGEPSATALFESEAAGPVLVIRATTGAEPGRTLTVRHHSLGPFDRTIEDVVTTAESVVPSDGRAEVRIAGRYARGDRVLVRVDLEGTALGAPLRLLAARLEVP